jgi:hypothetical protein
MNTSGKLGTFTLAAARPSPECRRSGPDGAAVTPMEATQPHPASQDPPVTRLLVLVGRDLRTGSS